MRIPRIFLDQTIQANSTINLSRLLSHQLGNVLRMRCGHQVIIFNGKGGQYTAEIKSIVKKMVVLHVGEFQDRDRESTLSIILEQGISRGQHMDFTIQKAVELGITRIIPLFTEFGNVKLHEERREKRMDHWKKIIISACEQSGRNKLPAIEAPVSLIDYITGSGRVSSKYILSPESDSTFKHLQQPEGKIFILCGPEGGLSHEEYELAVKYGYKPVNLGPRVLRTETASLAAIAALQYAWGDMA